MALFRCMSFYRQLQRGATECDLKQPSAVGRLCCCPEEPSVFIMNIFLHYELSLISPLTTRIG